MIAFQPGPRRVLEMVKSRAREDLTRVALLDVSIGRAAWDSHIHHARITEWFTANATRFQLGGCPLTESRLRANCRRAKYFPARSGSQTLGGYSWHRAVGGHAGDDIASSMTIFVDHRLS